MYSCEILFSSRYLPLFSSFERKLEVKKKEIRDKERGRAHPRVLLGEPIYRKEFEILVDQSNPLRDKEVFLNFYQIFSHLM